MIVKHYARISHEYPKLHLLLITFMFISLLASAYAVLVHEKVLFGLVIILSFPFMILFGEAALYRQRYFPRRKS